MLHASMSNIGIGLVRPGIAVHALIVPFLNGRRDKRVGGEKCDEDHQEDTDIKYRVFSWASEFLCLAFLPFVWCKIIAPGAGSGWRSGIHLLAFLVYCNVVLC